MAQRGPMEQAASRALAAAQPLTSDVAGVQLVRRYAQLLDAARGTPGEVEVYDRLGPKLLAALTALGMTAAGRGVKGRGVPDAADAIGAELDEFTERRRRRRSGEHGP